jgi:Family of unknown function (DUF5681)
MATDYEVGYKKPPKQSQFKQGQSGNPRGRPKGTKNLKTDLLEELSEQILVREGSRTRKISKQRAILKNLTAQTLKCDGRATSTLVNLMLRVLDPQDAADDEIPLTADEQDAFAVLKARLLQQSHAEPEGIDAVAQNGETK